MPNPATQPIIRCDRIDLAFQQLMPKLSNLRQTNDPSPLLLNHLSFSLFPGERVGIVGPAGTGKTSLLRLFNRLIEVSSGTIFFEEKDIRHIPVLQLRQQITLVLQESKLLGMTVRDALLYPLKLRNLPESVMQQRLSDWMDKLNLPTDWLDRTETQLSVGQRQMVAIARALMIQPKVLLLDEPTSALDVGRATQILDILTQLAKTEQLTIIMVNHQLDLVQDFCSRLLYLHQGQLLQDLAGNQVDWVDLRRSLIELETREAAEWGDPEE